MQIYQSMMSDTAAKYNGKHACIMASLTCEVKCGLDVTESMKALIIAFCIVFLPILQKTLRGLEQTVQYQLIRFN